MKKIILLSLLAGIGFIPYKAAAQVSLNVNIGSQPLWGPVGYDYAEYYYLPDVESYYYVPKRQFVYLDNGRWNFSLSLPSRYRGYDLYSGYKVVINSRNPYNNFENDRVRYAKYKKVRSQKAIKYSNDPRYYVVKGHPHGSAPGKAKKSYSSKGSGGGNVKMKDHQGGGNGKGGQGKGQGKGKH